MALRCAVCGLSVCFHSDAMRKEDNGYAAELEVQHDLGGHLLITGETEYDNGVTY